MLEELNIKNFALIESAHIEFKKGFTVLSGETGAGKSILIGSLAFLLGGKAGLEQIRSGCHEADVSGIFSSLESDGFPKEGLEWLDEHGIEADEGSILLRRVVRDTGKSSAWICGTPVTKADLSDFASFLVDIHGQHEQQSLMKVSEHRRYLDIYAGIVDEVKEFSSLYADLVEKRKTLLAMNTDEADRQNRIELLNFAVNEIDEAKLKRNEDEELQAEENRLSSFEKLYGDIDTINTLFEGNGDGSGILSLFRKISNTMPHAAAMDKNLESLESRIQSAFYEVEDISQECRRYAQELTFDPERLEQVQERLVQISKLKKKYASSPNSTLQDVLDYAENARAELERLGGAVENKSALEKEIQEAEKNIYIKAKVISAKRKTASDKMSHEVEDILKNLGMSQTRFSVNLAEKPGNDVTQRLGQYGMDDIEFLISANPGSPMAPLAKIASGGELSRVMLALKTILASGDTVGTLVFDEIDTGIGGEVAVGVGKHMKLLASQKQILCITHLASIAAYANNQIKIKKGNDGTTTQTNIFPVEGQDRVAEIARMLSGDADSQASLEHAKSMLENYGGV